MRLGIFLSVLFLSACATQTSSVRQAPVDNVSLQTILNTPEAHQDKTVRWGGAVARLKNYADRAELTIVEFPLTKRGKPITTENSAGRFVVETDRFLDPLIYKEGALVTVLGSINDKQTLTVDEKTLTAPVLTLLDARVWPDSYADRQRPYNPKHDDRFIGYGYYGTGSYSP